MCIAMGNVFFSQMNQELKGAQGEEEETNLSFWDDFARGERLLKEKQNNSTPEKEGSSQSAYCQPPSN